MLYSDFSLDVKCRSSLYLPKIQQTVANKYESSVLAVVNLFYRTNVKAITWKLHMPEVGFFRGDLTHRHGLSQKLKNVKDFHFFCRNFLLNLASRNKGDKQEGSNYSTKKDSAANCVFAHIQLSCQCKEGSTYSRCELRSHMYSWKVLQW